MREKMKSEVGTLQAASVAKPFLFMTDASSLELQDMNGGSYIAMSAWLAAGDLVRGCCGTTCFCGTVIDRS